MYTCMLVGLQRTMFTTQMAGCTENIFGAERSKLVYGDRP